MKNLLFAGLIALLVLPGCESTDTREEDEEDIRVVSWKSVTMSPANDSDVPVELKESFATDAFLAFPEQKKTVRWIRFFISRKNARSFL